MKLAIITDSTCDLTAEELAKLEVEAVPLHVHFQGGTFNDWSEIDPARIIAGVAAGAEMPSTSQPSPAEFSEAYGRAVAAGADQILVITISSEISGTFQSANIAKEDAGVPVTVFDSRAASLGHGEMVRVASRMRDEGAETSAIVSALERVRDTNFVIFTVATMDYLQKNGRIGRASALLGSLLNVKPLLTLEDGKVGPLSRARGLKKAQQEMVERLKAYAAAAGGPIVLNLIHVQDLAAAEGLRTAVDAAGIAYQFGGFHEIGAVIASHVGPNTFGLYAHEAV
ncbi:MAG: DegV family protein [Trueperaceae bacterium]|jgi:DegV family protein with EDD domain|nr:DegV family protein [Truepera sp.]HRN17472.1 DegV family protein [Trueperaceae bacterium]HRQ11195.1 DegV family protein [Trueperaceae bacterium]